MTGAGNPESIRHAPEQVLFESHPQDGVARIIVNRPEKRNALSVPMRARIAELVHRCELDDAVKVIIISGRGKAFSSGNEINEDWGQREPDYRRFPLSTAIRYGTDMTYGRQGFSQALSRSSKVTIAQIHGYCAAAAYFMIATKCDLVVAAPDASIGALEARFLGPAGAVSAIHLNRILGAKAARRLGYTAEPISGEEGKRLGMVHRCVAEAELEEATFTLASGIAARPAHRLLYLKARIAAAEGLLDVHTPAMPGLLFSHFLRSEKDELAFWNTVRKGGISAALKADKERARRGDLGDGST